MTTQEQTPQLLVNIKKLRYWLAGIWLLVIIFSLGGQYVRQTPNFINLRFPSEVHYFVVEFNVNAESNITTFYSAFLMAVSAFLLFVIAYMKTASKDVYRYHWTALAWVVLYLALDDASVIHEKTTKYLESLPDLGGWLEYRWVILGAAAVIILAISFFTFWLHLEGKYKLLFLVSAAIFFGGALGVEMIGGRWAAANGTKNFTYAWFTTLEQGIQYVGVSMLFYSLLSYVKDNYPMFYVLAADSEKSSPRLLIRPRRALYIWAGIGLGVVTLALTALYLTQFPKSYSFRLPFHQTLLADYALEFNVVEEANIVTFYNTLLLNIAAALLFLVAHFKRQSGDSYARYWLALAWVVLLVGLDDFAAIHEKVGGYFKDTSFGGPYRWIIVTAALFFALLLLLRPLWRGLAKKESALFITSISLYFTGVLARETIINRYWTNVLVTKSFRYFLFVTLGEGLQYLGMALLIYALLSYLAPHYPQFQVFMDKADKT